MNAPDYKCDERALVRCSTGPISWIQDGVVEQMTFGGLKSRPALQAALQIASPSLVTSIKASTETSQTARLALASYAIRAATRPTPFGLMGATGWCTLQEGPFRSLHVAGFDAYKLSRSVSPAHSNSTDDPVMPNPWIASVGSFYCGVVPKYSSPLNNGRNSETAAYKTVRVRSTNVLREVMEAEEPRPFNEVTASLSDKFKKPTSFTANYLNTLLEQGLVTRPVNTSLSRDLAAIDDGPISFDSLDSAAPEDLSKRLEESWFVEARIRHRHDDREAQELLTIPRNAIEQAANTVAGLAMLSPRDSLDAWHECFVERFGLYERVQITKAVSEQFGVGLPDSRNARLTRHNVESQRRALLWKEALHLAYAWSAPTENSLVRRVSDRWQDWLTRRCNEISPKRFGDMDLSVQPLMGEYPGVEAAFTPGGHIAHGGSLTARFPGNRRVPDSIESSRQVEVVFHPGDKSLHPLLLRDYVQECDRHLDMSGDPALLGSASSVQLQDVYVHATREQVLLTVHGDDCSVNFKHTNALAENLVPPLVRALITLSGHGSYPLMSWPYNSVARYDEPVVGLATGSVLLNHPTWWLSRDRNKPPSSSSSKIDRVFDEMGRPSWVRVNSGDRQSIVRSDAADFDALLTRWQARSELGLELSPVTNLTASSVLVGPDGPHETEVIVRLRSQDKAQTETEPRPQIRLHSGEHCAYSTSVHWIAPCESFDRLLSSHLWPYLQSSLESSPDFGLTFVRYRDVADHLRIRLPREANADQANGLMDLSRRLLACGELSRYESVPPYLEFSRYGGQDTFDHVQQVFRQDCWLALKHIASVGASESRLKIAAIAAVLDAFDSLMPEDDQGLEQLAGIHLPSAVIDLAKVEYRTHRDDLFAAACENRLIPPEGVEETIDGPHIPLTQVDCVAALRAKLDVLPTERRLQVVQDIAHMRFNRYLDSGGETERVALGTAKLLAQRLLRHRLYLRGTVRND